MPDWRRLALAGGLLGVLLLLRSGAFLAPTADPHRTRIACDSCHLRAPQGGEAETNLFVMDIEALCLRCHSRVSLRMSHPLGVQPTFSLPADMYLDWKGELTCSTCHTMHSYTDAGRASGNDAYLRRNSRGRAFCQECHRPGFLADRVAGHSLVADTVHGSRYTPLEGEGRLGASSVQCLTCHDGSASPDAGNTMLGPGIWRHGGYDGRSSHPIGVDYQRAAARRAREYRARSELPRAVQLPDGRVECLSCHNLYSEHEHLLVVDNRESRLCFTCHLR